MLLCFKKWSGRSHSIRPMQVENRLSMADYFCVSMMLSPVVASSMLSNRLRRQPSAYVLSAPLYMYMWAAHAFCLFFSIIFNIISGLSVNQSPTLSQKIDSREGSFWYKKGSACECGKMNLYSKEPPFAPTFGLFAVKYPAFSTKTQCILVLNAVLFGAKRGAFWC